MLIKEMFDFVLSGSVFYLLAHLFNKTFIIALIAFLVLNFFALKYFSKNFLNLGRDIISKQRKEAE